MRPRLAFVASLLAAVAGACGLFPSVSDLGAGDGAPPDATAENAPPDATAENAPPDAGDAGCPTITRVQSATTPGGPAKSVALQLTIHHGDLLVAVLGAQFAGKLTLADSAGNVWTTLPEVANASCVSDAAPWTTRAQLAYATVAADAVDDVVSFSTSSTQDYLTLTVAEYATSGSLALSQSRQASADASTAVVTVGPLATSGCNNVVVAMLADELPGNDTWTLFPGFSVLSTDGNWSFVAVDDVGAPPGTVDTGASHPSTDSCWVAAAASFAAH